MNIFLDCIPCFIRQTLDAVRLVTDNELIHEQLLREVLDLSRGLDLQQSPPVIGQQIHRRIRQLTNNPDPYLHQKQQQNQLALELYNLMEPVVHNSKNPLENAVRLAIAGNIIDLGVKTSISDEDIQKTIKGSLAAPLDQAMIEEFQSDIENAQDILYLADNAGEIVFDRLLIEQLSAKKITAVVKGSPVINDATMEDAISTGLTKIVPVIDNGSDGPGTILQTCSDEFLSRFEQADLIISKGQGNFETLSEIEKNIYFLLKVKCPVIAQHLQVPVGTFFLGQKGLEYAKSIEK